MGGSKQRDARLLPALVPGSLLVPLWELQRRRKQPARRSFWFTARGRRVADLLEKNGHKVYAPTLTGLGERSHLMSGLITLDTHVTDVVNVIKWENLDNIILVGHSYAGFVVSGVAEKSLPAISSIVFLDAFLPDNGQRVVDLAPPELKANALKAAERNEVGRPVPPAKTFNVNDKVRRGSTPR